MRKKKIINLIENLCHNLLAATNDNEAMKYKGDWFTLKKIWVRRAKLYNYVDFITRNSLLKDGLKGIDIYFKGGWFLYHVKLERLQEFFIPEILEGLKKHE